MPRIASTPRSWLPVPSSPLSPPSPLTTPRAVSSLPEWWVSRIWWSVVGLASSSWRILSSGPPISVLVLSSFSRDATSLPSDSLSRLVWISRVSSATSRFLSDSCLASSGDLSTTCLSSLTSTITMLGGGGWGACVFLSSWLGGGGSWGGGGSTLGGGLIATWSASSSFSASILGGG